MARCTSVPIAKFVQQIAAPRISLTGSHAEVTHVNGSTQVDIGSERRRAGCPTERLARRGTVAQRTALRARIVLAAAAGADNKAVAADLRVRAQTVGKWRQRFVEHRLDGLLDEPRCGAPRKVTDEQVEDVVVRTLETTPAGCTHWSTRQMAKACGLGRTTIGRIWQAFGLKPHRTETTLSGVERASCRRTRSSWRRSATSWAST
jgi:transposase